MRQFLATEHPCTCGGAIYISSDDSPLTVAHTLPPCAEYERLDTVADAADFLARLNAAHTH